MADEGMKPSQINKEWRDFTASTPNLSNVITGPDGLPMYYFQFKDIARERQPGITDSEIAEAWREVH